MERWVPLLKSIRAGREESAVLAPVIPFFISQGPTWKFQHIHVSCKVYFKRLGGSYKDSPLLAFPPVQRPHYWQGKYFFIAGLLCTRQGSSHLWDARSTGPQSLLSWTLSLKEGSISWGLRLAFFPLGQFWKCVEIRTHIQKFFEMWSCYFEKSACRRCEGSIHHPEGRWFLPGTW